MRRARSEIPHGASELVVGVARSIVGDFVARLRGAREACAIMAARVRVCGVAEALERDELDALRRFLTVRRLGAVDEPIKEVTAMKYEEHLREAGTPPQLLQRPPKTFRAGVF